MPRKCIRCGQDNDDRALRCVCGSELPAITTAVPAPASASSLLWARIGFAIWTIGFVPLYGWLCLVFKYHAVHRSLIGTAVYLVSAVLALLVLGRDPRRTLLAWRIGFVAWALLLLPLLLNVAQGLAQEGWPRGRFNRQVAHLLILVLIFSVPAFLTSLCALVRTYRVAGVLAYVTGLAYLWNGELLLRATAPAKGWVLRFEDVLDVVLFGSQVATHVSKPVGIVLIIGGLLTLRAVQTRTPAAIQR
jgi:hypothetical protein